MNGIPPLPPIPTIPHPYHTQKSILSPLIASNFALFPPTISTHTIPQSQPKTAHQLSPRSAIPNQCQRNPAVRSPFKFENPLTINYPGGFAGFNSLCNQPPPLPASNARTQQRKPFYQLPLCGSQLVRRGFPGILNRATRLR